MTLTFDWFEYMVFSIMLGLSAIIGIYFGCIQGGQNTVSGYLLGGKKMPVFHNHYISGITLLGIPSETYLYGTQLYAIVLANVIVTIVILIFYLPVLYPLQYNSVFEYLERRFNHSVRCIASIMYAIFLLTYIPVVIYVPSLAFNQVTGVPVQKLAPIVCAVCVFYTTLGGLKAVVWTDAVQSLFTFGSVIEVTIIGCRTVGGLANVFETSDKGHRLEFFNMDPDLFARNTFWTVVIGSSFSWFALVGLNPGTIQRFTALPNYRDARIAAIVCCIGIAVIKSVATINGLIIYTKYHDCDPVKTKVIEKPDQILPYYVMDVARDYPGLSGLFISGIVSTALSTMSTGLNVISGTIYEDFLKPCFSKKFTEKQASLIMKFTVGILGVVFLCMVFVVEKLGAILQLAISLGGLSLGAICFVFTFGMFLPWATSKGAIAGSLSSIIIMSWIIGCAQNAFSRGDIQYTTKVVSIEGCPLNTTLLEGANTTKFGYEGYGTPVVFDDDLSYVYRISSFLHYSTVGFIIGCIIGVLVTLITGTQDLSELDPKLIIPQMRRFIIKKEQSKTEQFSLKQLLKRDRNL